MTGLLSIPIMAIAVVLQATFLPQFRLLGGTPDLVFLFIVCWALNAKLEEGVTWALVGGILQDVVSAAPTGVTSLSMVIVVFVIYGIVHQFYRVTLFLIVAFVLLGTVFHKLVFMIILTVSGVNVNVLNDLSYVVLPTVAYNVVAVWPIYFIVRRLQRGDALSRRKFG